MIIDAHTHVVSADRDTYPLHRTGLPGGEWVDVAPDAPTFAADLAVAGVDRAVLVQPNGAYRYDNSYMVDSLVADPARFVGMATVDMTAADAAAQVAQLHERGVAGLRVFSIPTPEPASRWLDSAGTDDVIFEAVRLGVVVAVCVLPAEVHALVALAQRHDAGLRFLVDHAAFVDLVPNSDAAHKLFARENLVLKITTHVLDHHRELGVEGAELLAWLESKVGPDRLVWGSDWAQTHDRPYADLVQLGRDAAAGLSPTAASAFLGGTAARLWNLT